METLVNWLLLWLMFSPPLALLVARCIAAGEQGGTAAAVTGRQPAGAMSARLRDAS